MTETLPEVPQFPLPPPRAYNWLVDRGLVGFSPNSSMQPWYLLSGKEAFCVSDRWPIATEPTLLFSFARRQDCDELACFAWGQDGNVSVVTIQGWTPRGYEVVGKYATVWDWLRAVVSDIEEWVALDDGSA